MSNWWPLIRLLPKKTDFRFVSYSKGMGIISLVLVILSFVAMFSGGLRQNPADIWANAGPGIEDKVMAFACSGFNCGVDFKGGTSMVLIFPEAAPLAEIRAAASAFIDGDVQVQTYGEINQALLRFETPDDVNPTTYVGTVKERLSAMVPNITYGQTEAVGAKVSGELFEAGVFALGLAILLMLVYIWFRFELNYGIGAVLALFHDVILTMGLLSVLQMEFSLTSIAALLTIIGYSMNDTVVVFDRMRENRRKYKKMPWAELVDLSVNETLSRTIITGGTGVLALLGLCILGGPAMFTFAFAMVFGIIVGTYSSIYVAAPAVLWFANKTPKVQTADDVEANAMP
jgi:preprotein translocase subunit SecF